MTADQNTIRDQASTTIEDEKSGSEKKSLNSSEGGDRLPDSVIGKIQLTFHRDGLVDFEVLYLGLLTLGRLEAALPQIYQKLMLARAAASRKADGLPEHFNL